MDEERNRVIEDIQKRRDAMGTIPMSKRTRSIRVGSKKPHTVLLLYTFVLGMLFFPAFTGEYAMVASFVFVLVAWIYTYLKE
jgi:hypothetical protein